jgi:hypothetical protein
MVPPVNRAPALLSCFGAIALVVACADLKSAEPSSGDGTASPSSSSGTSGTNTSGGPSGTGTTSSSGGSSGTPLGPGGGAGPFGALPFGYCCNDDSECRDRHCVQVGSSKMCLDDCRAPETCQGKTLPSGFTCDGSQSAPGMCQPPSGFTCLAANTFNLGTKPAMSCCTQTMNGTNGLECTGGHCFYYKESQDPDYEPPEFCTNRCDLPQDCGKGMKCQLELGYCVPANDVFECQ